MNETPSLSDIAAVTNNDGFGGNNGWWIIIILFALFGWGRNGYGANNGSDVQSGYALATDFATLERKMDGIQGGLCDGFYAQNTNLLNGFSGVQNTLAQGFAGLNTALVQQGYETRMGDQATQTQLASCCCDLKGLVKDAVTQGIMNTNTIQQTMNQMTFQNQQNYCETLRAIHDVQDGIINHMNAEKMQTLRDENQALRLAASQQAQNNYLIGELRPAPSPAYVVPNPYCNCNTGCYQRGCGC